MIDPHNMTVLICDDMIAMCRSIHKMMKVAGFGGSFHYAHNGKEALSVLKRDPVDILLIDYSMPVKSGGETLAEIREDPLLRDLPVLMISANASIEYVAEVAETDIDAFITKPLTVKVLGEKVNYVVEKTNNPPPVIKHLRTARDYEEAEDLDAAVREAELAVSADPYSSRPIRELGYYYLQKNERQKAEELLLKAAQMNDLDVVAFHLLGELYIEQKAYGKAQHYLEKAMEISPRHLSRGVQFGKTLVQLNENDRAVEVFKSVIKQAGATFETMEEIGNICLGTGTSAYAAKLFETILAENPDRQELYHKIGLAWKTAGNTNEALSNLSKAEEHDHDNIDIKLDLARTFITLNKPIMAERVLKRAQQVNPEHSEVKKLIQQCIAMDDS